MTNIYDVLSSDLTAEFNWRLREIHQLRTAIKDVDQRDRAAITRASFVLLYAHWEGFIKAATRIYYEYAVRLNKPVRSLHSGARIVSIRKELGHRMSQGNSTNRKMMELIDFVDGSGNKKLSKASIRDIATTSNMDFGHFEDICVLIGCDASAFEEDRNLIDKILVQRRHQIAHGNYLEVDYDDFVETSNRIIAIIKFFRSRLENSFIEICKPTPHRARRRDRKPAAAVV